MSETQVQAATIDDVVTELAEECAIQAASYVDTLREIASGDNAAAAIPMGLLAVSQVLVMGARLGAIEDIVPRDQFESDAVVRFCDELKTAFVRTAAREPALVPVAVQPHFDQIAGMEQIYSTGVIGWRGQEGAR